MRTIFISSLLSLIFLAGCSQTAVDSEKPKTTNNAVAAEADSPENVVEPLVPKTDAPEAPKKETEHVTPETTAVISEIFGKYAVEAVPLPPINDLTGQVDEYITKLSSALEGLDGSTKYKENAADVVRDTHALSLIALAIGLSEAESKYKKAASQIIIAAKTLAAADNLEAGQKAYEALKSALTETGDPASLSWTAKTADLTPLMKAVPNLSSTIKRLTNTEKKLKAQMDKKPAQIFGALAALAVIPQGSIANAAETVKPDAAAEWKKDCEQFRDAALKANAAAHQFAEGKADYASFKASIDAMTESCHQCHVVSGFCPSASEKNDE